MQEANGCSRKYWTLVVTTQSSVEQVRSLLRVAFPMRVPDAYYKSILNGEIISLEARHIETDVVIGQVSWGPDRDSPEDQIYIYSLAVDALHRGEGIGTALVDELMRRIRDNSRISKVALHVQSTNEDAIRFYERLGFVQDKVCYRFYPRLTYPDAFRLVRIVDKGIGTN